MNEPVVVCDPGGGKVWPKRLYAAVRSSETRLALVLWGSFWVSAEGLAALDPKDIPDDNVIWTVHSYQPLLLTTQGATCADDFIRYVVRLFYLPYFVPRRELDAMLEQARTKIRAKALLLCRAGMRDGVAHQPVS